MDRDRDLEPLWSVRFVLPEAYANRLSSSIEAGVDRSVHRVSLGGSDSPSTFDPPHITLRLEAPDQATAQAQAHTKVERMANAAGLPPLELPIAWVAPVPRDTSKRRDFLEDSKSLLANDYAAMAVVAAQTHLEQQVVALLEAAMPLDVPPWLRRFPETRGAGNLGRLFTQEVVQVLWGIKVTELPEWNDLMAHAARRNAVVHEGVDILETDAEASIRVVEAVWARLTAAVREAGS